MRSKEPTPTDVAVSIASEAVDGLTPSEVIEVGVAIVAKGIYRSRKMNGPAEAAGDAQAVIAALRSTMLDDIRAANLVAKSRGYGS